MRNSVLLVMGTLVIGFAQVGLMDSETEVQAPIREGEKPVIPLDTGDPIHVSAMNANRIVREALTGMARRKMGLTVKHYLSPITETHDQKK